MASVKEIKKQLMRTYGKRDFTGRMPTNDDILTVHHIRAKRNGGCLTIYNSALLCRSTHDKFNLIEAKFPLIAETLNEDFQLYKQKGDRRIMMDNAYYIDKYYLRALQKCGKSAAKVLHQEYGRH